MASTSETGHAKNVANLESLIAICNGYGAAYNPSKASIQLTALTTLHNNARAALTHVNNTKAALIQATNQRKAQFSPLRKLATRIVSALDATEASDALVRDAKTIKHKIHGRRATPRKSTAQNTPDTPPQKQISSAQLSFDSIIEHFEKLIDILSTEPSYTPNEPELQLSQLHLLIGQLRSSNTAVINANTAYSNARIARNNILYAPPTGLYPITIDVKNYVKSVFGASSPQYKQLTALKFTPLKK